MMLVSILSLTSIGLVLGFLLSAAARFFRVDVDPLEEEIEAMLPGSQCGQCGFPGCGPAAQALVKGEIEINFCPPGGPSLINELAQKLGVTVSASDMEFALPEFAKIDESRCIGCTRCYKVCPTDAIIGANKQIHGVVEDACIGCKKCVDICPTECLQMYEANVTLKTWHWPKPKLQTQDAL